MANKNKGPNDSTDPNKVSEADDPTKGSPMTEEDRRLAARRNQERAKQTEDVPLTADDPRPSHPNSEKEELRRLEEKKAQKSK